MSGAKRTPERLSAFSDGVFAVLITVLVLDLHPPEIPTFRGLVAMADLAQLCGQLSLHRDRLGQSPPSLALCHRGDAPPYMVQFRAFVFRVAAAIVHCLDGCQRVGTAARRILRLDLLPRECHLYRIDLGAHRTGAAR